jgi:hypothetical protein
MFPGIDGFHWTVGHVLFLSLFFAVALTIATTVALCRMEHCSRFSHASRDRPLLEVGLRRTA